MSENGTQKPRVYSGWKDIAAALNRSVDTVMRWAMRNVDPLPIFADPGGTPTLRVDALQDWVDRNSLPFAAYQALRHVGALPAQQGQRPSRARKAEASAAARGVVKRPKKNQADAEAPRTEGGDG